MASVEAPRQTMSLPVLEVSRQDLVCISGIESSQSWSPNDSLSIHKNPLPEGISVSVWFENRGETRITHAYESHTLLIDPRGSVQRYQVTKSTGQGSREKFVGTSEDLNRVLGKLRDYSTSRLGSQQAA